MYPITADTLITYPAGSTRERGQVLATVALPDGRHAVFLDRTCFHPVDNVWADQPSDEGFLLGPDGQQLQVSQALVGASDGTHILVADDITARRGEPGWFFLVAHIVPYLPVWLAAGIKVTAVVDADLRRAYSVGHTACHLAALALNSALSESWRKEVRADSLGNPDFDALTCVSSKIKEFGSTECFRVGKSVRKKGFSPEILTDNLAGLQAKVNATLAQWIAAKGPCGVESVGPEFSARRTWFADLGQGLRAELPCGGTHITSLSDFGSLVVDFSFEQVGAGGELWVQVQAKLA